MTAISSEAFQRAQKVRGLRAGDNLVGVAELIQTFSDAAKAACGYGGSGVRDNLAPFILADPVDPLLIEAREIVGVSGLYDPTEAETALLDGSGAMRIALAALKRGMELAPQYDTGKGA